jgi:hypothetical protein
MACQTYQALEQDLKGVRTEFAYFTFDENKTLRGMSDRQSKQCAKKARERISELSKEISWHRQTCAECKGETS